jgi:predicted kinase
MIEDYKERFIEWYFNEFKFSEYYKEMSKMSEDSLHHSEHDIGTHTDMVVANYIGMAPFSWLNHDYIGALACAFHDVGKPKSLIFKHSEERGDYKAFHGHEVLSARMFEDWAMNNMEHLTNLDLTKSDIFMTAWLIEHHLPWGVTNPNKLMHIAATLEQHFSDSMVFVNMLKSDATGRIKKYSQAQRIENQTKQQIWINNLNLVMSEYPYQTELSVDKYNKDVFICIGPSGSGKTTKVMGNVEPQYIHSMDTLRHEWYDAEDYHNAFVKSCEDSDFENKVRQHFTKMIKENLPYIFVDNTNLTKKRRSFYINAAKQHGYNVKAILFQNSINTLIERMDSRDDKKVPASVIINQYNKLQLPSFGEFDNILII